MPTHLKRARRVLDIEIEALQELRGRLDRSFSGAIEHLESTLRKKGKLIITGVGKSGHIAEKIAATFTSTGAPSVFLNPLNATHGDLGIVTRVDSVIALSYSGETEELCRVVPVLKREAKCLIGITGGIDSTLAKASDVVLDVSVKREACPHNLAPTSSTTAMLALGDALAMALLEAQGFKEADFARFHPGGSIGRHLLMQTKDVMRPIESIALLKPEESVQTAMQAMSKHRCGAAIVINASGTLAGIYTHGDFTRSYLQNPNIGEKPLKTVMTRKPITVRDTLLAAEVLKLLESHNIDDIVVLNSKRHPVGLIDVQDLARLKLL
ncbi:MAG: KpsF/GutQ family sugar-phosphate isomerase [Verrucomicrobiota bacterium]